MSVQEFVIHVDDQGRAQFIYDDSLAFLLALGTSETKRASHVEPAPGGGWTADMSPVGGPVLGLFDLRQTALDEEVAWLKTNYLGKTGTNQQGKNPGASGDGARNPSKGDVDGGFTSPKSPKPRSSVVGRGGVPVAEVLTGGGLPLGTD